MNNILLIEDNIVLARDLKTRLEDNGYHVIHITNSLDLNKCLEDNNVPDIALVDIKINGEEDGIDLAKHLRKYFGIRSIFISGHSDKRILLDAFEAQPLGFILKPIDDIDFRNILDLIVRSNQMDIRDNLVDFKEGRIDLDNIKKFFETGEVWDDKELMYPIYSHLFFSKDSSLISIVTDTSGNLVAANKVLADLLDTDMKRYIGKSWMDNFIPDREKEIIKKIHLESTRSGRSSFINHIISPDKLIELLVAFDNFSIEDRVYSIGINITGVELASEATEDIDYLFSRFSENINRLKRIRQRYNGLVTQQG